MLVRQIRFTFSTAILLSFAALVLVLADWIRALPFDIDLKQQTLILLCAGSAFLLWDHFFLLHTAPYTRYEYRLFSYLASGLVGFVFLALSRFVPGLYSKNLSDPLSNGLMVAGIFLLLVTAFLRFTNLHQQHRVWDILWLIGLSTLIFLFSRGLFTYLFLCLTSVFAGRGLLSLLGIPELNRKSLAPFAILVFWSIMLGAFIGLGIPIKYLSLAIWSLTLWLVWQGTKNKKLDQSFDIGDLLLVAIPLLLVFKYTLYGFFLYPGSINFDHWNYIVMGEYLWESSRCADGLLTPMYEFANQLVCVSRYVSAGFLSFFSVLLNGVGDAQPSTGIFLPWGMFVYCASLRFMIENMTINRSIRIAYLLFGALAGWLMMLVMTSNFDNLLVISYLPVIFAISLQTDFSWRWNILLGLLLASVGYTYMEMVPFIYLAVGFFLLKRTISLKAPSVRILKAFVTIGMTTLTVLLPYLSTAISFLQFQVSAINPTQQLLPGQGFWLELISPTYQWIALWGMGAAIYDGGFYAFRTAVAVVLYALLIYGCYVLIKTREWALFAAIMIFAGALLYFDFYRHYAYGTYKLLVLFWWLIAYVVVLAFKTILDSNPQSRRTIHMAGISGYFAYFVSVVILAAHVIAPPFNSIEPFKQLENLPIPPGKSVAAIITNDFNNTWAAYYLRNQEVFLYPLGGYMRGYIDPLGPTVKQANLSDTEYLVTDSVNGNLPGKRVWRNSRYSLWELPDTWAYSFDIKNTNGVEVRNKKQSFWLNNDVTEIRIVSDFDGCGQMTFDAKLGPNLPKVPVRHLAFSSNDETESITVASGTVDLFLDLKKGPDNVVKLQVLDRPTFFAQPGAAERIMLLEVHDLRIKKCISS